MSQTAEIATTTEAGISPLSKVEQSLNSIKHQTTQVRFSLNLAQSNLSKYLTLRHVQDQNEGLFFHYIRDNIRDSLPYIYTPSVGDACQQYSYLNFAPRGLYLSAHNSQSVKEQIESINQDVDIIVITDGSRVLGLGDLGIGGMGISIGKLSLYTAVGGIAPERTLPVCIDVGTNNAELKADPQYLGNKEDRVDDETFYSYLEEVMTALEARWPKAIIQFEDFSNNHAYPLLKKYRHTHRCFNDDIQGTATVAVATIKRALKKANKQASQSNVFIVGGGSAGCGIADLIRRTFGFEGENGVYVLDRDGVVYNDFANLNEMQAELARPSEERPAGKDKLELLDAINYYKPDVIVGVTGVTGLFSEQVINALVEHADMPVIMPLSNPVSSCEVTPSQIFDWVGDKAIVATGSPFAPIDFNGKSHVISQCNNVYVFPGIGLGAQVVSATTISEGMLTAAVNALGNYECNLASHYEVLPAIESTLEVSKEIAVAVALQAISEGVAEVGADLSRDELIAKINAAFWNPELGTANH
ncbi:MULTISPECIES: oxaloacetate-decarboxylating malate dehydrogenase [Vibrio]|uniref:Oxaloacetate-decarboxylating malate dehydrogenase n=2 Tax=Vibrio TaxID=662 RepID=A0A7X4LMU3_9VIBR|nr:MULTISPECIES: oxaloacetate-decarboxylating malate dehydrogenase [Vibrio]MBF9003030.1 oxaloacetate-decarboxylating malate dehydrogenase [Vibrio nitrifigilis]MZI94527.1 oxaloacetate-decarboxylating malate dehydrogenase [Vibrio eleionomae]